MDIRIKPLEWKELSTGWIAHTSFHAYEVVKTDHGFMATYANSDFAWGAEDAMKAAAQADYERRALSALSPAPVGVTDENAMAWGAELKSAEARILELEADLEVAGDKLRRITDALTPSVETKAAYMGEFHMGITLMHNGDEDHRRVMIPWTSIKEIMAAIRARAALGGQSNE